jgi:hypothetical protein
MRRLTVLASAVALGLLAQSALAAVIPYNVTVDEYGVGTLTNTITGEVTALPFAIAPDPGPGGLPAVLTYTLPFAVIPGDVLMTEPGGAGIQDVLRFNGTTLAFYSDNLDGFDSLADTATPPVALYTNLVTIAEVGPEGNNGAFYTPVGGNPGSGSTIFTYHFISDGHNTELGGPVPTPAAATAGAALLSLLGLGRRRRRAC